MYDFYYYECIIITIPVLINSSRGFVLSAFECIIENTAIMYSMYTVYLTSFTWYIIFIK